MALALRAALSTEIGEHAKPVRREEAQQLETIVDLGDRLLNLDEVRCVRFRPGFLAGTAKPVLWADIEFDNGAVKSVFGATARRLRTVLLQDGLQIEVTSATSL
jgi:hypothetical protein